MEKLPRRECYQWSDIELKLANTIAPSSALLEDPIRVSHEA
jgi:hypothetical protein